MKVLIFKPAVPLLLKNCLSWLVLQLLETSNRLEASVAPRDGYILFNSKKMTTPLGFTDTPCSLHDVGSPNMRRCLRRTGRWG